MIDFGLKPCPLCGGEAEVARLTQGPEHQSAVIKCTDCGLTLEWETNIKVSVSRSGKRVAVAGINPIEAWNRRQGFEACDTCGYKIHSEEISKLASCNDCGTGDACEYKPRPGQLCRINCPLWQPMEGKA